MALELVVVDELTDVEANKLRVANAKVIRVENDAHLVTVRRAVNNVLVGLRCANVSGSLTHDHRLTLYYKKTDAVSYEEFFNSLLVAMPAEIW